MSTLFEHILAAYGQTVTVFHAQEDARTVRAFLQGNRDAGKAEPFAVTPLGTVDDRTWIYLGSAPVDPGDTVAFKGESFTVHNAQAVWVGDEISHWWAALTLQKEAAV